jgi:hypothetical protein
MWEVGTRLRHKPSDREYEVIRVTPAGAGGTSVLDGPTFHARIVVNGTTVPGGYVRDVWSKSMSNPTTDFEEVTCATRGR